VQLVVDHCLVEMIRLESKAFDFLCWKSISLGGVMSSNCLKSLPEQRLARFGHTQHSSLHFLSLNDLASSI
jgi:hypothetical protein